MQVRDPSLHRHYPASLVVRSHPPSASVDAIPRGLVVDGWLPPTITAADFPCCAQVLRYACCHHYPGGTDGACRSFPHRRRPSSLLWRVGFHIRRFRGLLGVHSRCGPHSPLHPLQGGFPRVLQVICHLLTRPGCFRLERESPGGTWYPRNPCTLTGHTQQRCRESNQGLRSFEEELSVCRLRRCWQSHGHKPLLRCLLQAKQSRVLYLMIVSRFLR